jgi:WD40 repeat protein
MVHHLQFSADGRWLISASADHDVHLWDAQTAALVATLRHGSIVYQTAIHPTEARLASACADGSIRLWDLERFEEVAELRGHASYVKSVVFTHDGQQLISGSGDGTVRVWDKRPWAK